MRDDQSYRRPPLPPGNGTGRTPAQMAAGEAVRERTAALHRRTELLMRREQEPGGAAGESFPWFTVGPNGLAAPAPSAGIWLSGKPRVMVLVGGTTTGVSEVELWRNDVVEASVEIAAGTNKRAYMISPVAFLPTDIYRLNLSVLGAGAEYVTAKTTV